MSVNIFCCGRISAPSVGLIILTLVCHLFYTCAAPGPCLDEMDHLNTFEIFHCLVKFDFQNDKIGQILALAAHCPPKNLPFWNFSITNPCVILWPIWASWTTLDQLGHLFVVQVGPKQWSNWSLNKHMNLLSRNSRRVILSYDEISFPRLPLGQLSSK